MKLIARRLTSVALLVLLLGSARACLLTREMARGQLQSLLTQYPDLLSNPSGNYNNQQGLGGYGGQQGGLNGLNGMNGMNGLYGQQQQHQGGQQQYGQQDGGAFGQQGGAFGQQGGMVPNLGRRR